MGARHGQELKEYERRNGVEMRFFSNSRALFNGRLVEGSNTVNVRYIQPLSILEARYGYFVSSRFVEHFLYILEPLKEWKLAENFALDLKVSTLRKRADRDPWKLFKRRSISCSLPGGEVSRENGRVVYRNRVGREFPDFLVCVMGDRDLLSDRFF